MNRDVTCFFMLLLVFYFCTAVVIYAPFTPLLECDKILYCTVLFGTVLYCHYIIVLYCAVLYCTLLC